jgi:hypothetical protein
MNHSWTAGMMYVDDEDLEMVAASGRKIECEKCDKIYDPNEEYEEAMESDFNNMGF